MPNTFAGTRVATLLAAVVVALVSQPRATGQEPALEVFYTKLEPKEHFKYKWKATEGACTAGVFRWEVPAIEFGTNGLGRTFTGFCAEVPVPVTADKRYRFQVNSIYAPQNYGLPANADGVRAAERRARYVRELFGRFYREPVTESPNAIALQLALWEVIQETEPADGPPKLDLFGDDFRADYPRAEAPAYVLRAQEYLDALTGKDDPYYGNPDLRGRELVRLQGIANAQGVTAQSQLVLRSIDGRTAGGGVTRALTAGGGFDPAGVNDPRLAGPDSTLPTTGGGRGRSAASTVAPVDPPSTPTSSASRPTSDPISPSTLTSPPSKEPDASPGPSSSPVPAPAGLLLSFIALGVVGSWRLAGRLHPCH